MAFYANKPTTSIHKRSQTPNNSLAMLSMLGGPISYPDAQYYPNQVWTGHRRTMAVGNRNTVQAVVAQAKPMMAGLWGPIDN